MFGEGDGVRDWCAWLEFWGVVFGSGLGLASGYPLVSVGLRFAVPVWVRVSMCLLER